MIDVQQISKIIEAGESLTVEFKSDRQQTSVDSFSGSEWKRQN